MECSQKDAVWPLSAVQRGLRLLGLWSPSEDRRLPQLLALCCVLAAHVFLLLTNNGSLIMDTPSDLPQLSFTAYNSLTVIGLTAKVVSFPLEGARLSRMLQLLAEARRRFPDSEGRRDHHHHMALRLHRFLEVSYRMNSAMWTVAPIVAGAIASARADGRPVKRGFMMPLWLPLDTQSSPTYEILLGVQVPCCWICSETSVLLDCAMLALMLQAAAELAVLNDRLCGVGSDRAPSAEPTACHKDTPPAKASYHSEGKSAGAAEAEARSPLYSHDEMFRSLVENINHHQIIINYMHLLQMLLSRGISVLLICNTISICFHIVATVALLQEDIEPVGMTKMVLGSTLYAYQTAILCLLGQRITTQSERLPASAFSCDWPAADGRFRRLLIVFCVRSSQALVIRVCGLYSLSRETLLQVLKAAYTLFNFVYQTVGEEEPLN
ncbi:odorant receptor 59a-like [Schistocerca gregaria]|uniref:odorant receptor 59a-like n=1 Tax=Schistocerca gregaria TaxID=7010 RepID=UPI00211F28FD|nr:odorant receptor 59a-like [Schistocerca gregaria]